MKMTTVLIVFGDQRTRKKIGIITYRNGFMTVYCESPKDAVKFLDDDVGVVITGFNFPKEMDGAEFADKIKAQRPNILVVILTTDPTEVPENHADAVFDIFNLKNGLGKLRLWFYQQVLMK
jgi:DNA-binding NtrC family response regulator